MHIGCRLPHLLGRYAPPSVTGNIFHVHSEPANGVLDLAVAEQHLHGWNFFPGLLGDQGLCSPGRVRTVLLAAQTYDSPHSSTSAGMLFDAQMTRCIQSAGQGEVVYDTPSV